MEGRGKCLYSDVQLMLSSWKFNLRIVPILHLIQVYWHDYVHINKNAQFSERCWIGKKQICGHENEYQVKIFWARCVWQMLASLYSAWRRTGQVAGGITSLKDKILAGWLSNWKKLRLWNITSAFTIK